MILYLQLKEIFRHKRFIFFTLIMPVLWFISMIIFFRSENFDSIQFANLCIITACLMGISGNSIITFSNTISKSRKFYRLQDKISLYSAKRYLVDQLKMQFILNALICITVIIMAFLSNEVHFTISFTILILMVLLMGLYLSVIGYLLGIILDAKTIQALSFPIMTVVMILLVPFNVWFSGTFANIITNIQKIFPGYYLYHVAEQPFTHLNIWTNFFKFSVDVIVTGFIFITVIRIIQTKYNR